MRCHHCGNENPDTNNFCGGCGTRLTKPAPSFTLGTQPSSFLSNGGTVFTTTIPQSAATTQEYMEPLAATSERSATTEIVEAQPSDLPKPDPSNEPVTETQPSISGPSFLGLTNAPETEGDYLLLDEPRRSRTGWYIVCLLVIAAAVAVGWFEWKKISAPEPQTPPTAPQSQVQPPPASSSQQSPAASGSQLPQSDDTGDHLTTVDPSVKNWGGTSDISADPNAVKDDPSATRSDMTRQARDAAKRRREEKQQDEAKPQPAKVKPMSEKQPDPQQNKLLLLGEKYLYGGGAIARNCEQAIVYFRAAAEQDNVPAMSHLAALYESGECSKRDPEQAYSWLKRAHDADPSNPWIERDMQIMQRQMSSQQRASVR
jgi:hypothetical protein